MKFALLFITTLFTSQVSVSAQANELHDAIHANNKANVEKLLSKGADINAKDKYQMTPLHWAVIEGKKELVALLIAKGADVRIQDERQRTTLHWAAGEYGAESAEFSIGEGASKYVTQNVIEQAASSKGIAIYIEIAKFLITKGVDVNAKSNNDSTPLFSVGSKEMAALLIAHGANVNAKSTSGATPLHKAAMNKKEIAEMLIEKGADVNAKNNDGQSPLAIAVLQNEKEIVALLIKKSAELNPINKNMPADYISPGLYYNESGSATLGIYHSATPAALFFTLNSKNENGHECNVGGQIVNNKAITEEKCVIQFIKTQDNISVTAPDEFGDACRNHCGAGNTTFSDDFLIAAPYCSSADHIQDEFSRNYKLAQYPKARDLLRVLLSKCERFMGWRTDASTRNDLAITEFRLKDNAACLKTLEPLKSDFIDDHDISEMSFRYPLMDEDLVQAMIKTTRFNWKKCGGTLQIKNSVGHLQ